MKTIERITYHINFNPADYQYLREKGYNNEEILAFGTATANRATGRKATLITPSSPPNKERKTGP